MPKKRTLPLLYTTPDAWAASASTDIDSLLSDHAYLERKAATNVLELFNRWPWPNPKQINKEASTGDGVKRDVRLRGKRSYPEDWVATLSAIARDEAQHLNQVIGLIQRRGGHLERFHRSQYASDLRQLVRAGQGPADLLDRLLVSALIEARSCERFEILARQLDDATLARFYRQLCASEFGHYTVFLRLARQVVSSADVDKRWAEMLKYEAEIIQRQPVGPLLHSSYRP